MNPFYFILCFITLASSGAVNPAHRENNLEARASSGGVSIDQYEYNKQLGRPPPRIVDGTRFQVWIRLNQEIPTDEFYKNDMGFTHNALRDLIGRAGGKHTDVVIGRGGQWVEYGLFFKDPLWRNFAESGLGYETIINVQDLRNIQGVKWTYVGLIHRNAIKSAVDRVLLKKGKFNSHQNVLIDIFPVAAFEILN